MLIPWRWHFCVVLRNKHWNIEDTKWSTMHASLRIKVTACILKVFLTMPRRQEKCFGVFLDNQTFFLLFLLSKWKIGSLRLIVGLLVTFLVTLSHFEWRNQASQVKLAQTPFCRSLKSQQLWIHIIKSIMTYKANNCKFKNILASDLGSSPGRRKLFFKEKKNYLFRIPLTIRCVKK